MDLTRSGLIVFSLLWAVSCLALLALLAKKLREADKLLTEASRNYQDAVDSYDEAIRYNAEARKDNETAQVRLKQFNRLCLN